MGPAHVVGQDGGDRHADIVRQTGAPQCNTLDHISVHIAVVAHRAQFSREYLRQFGAPPARGARQARQAIGKPARGVKTIGLPLSPAMNSGNPTK